MSLIIKLIELPPNKEEIDPVEPSFLQGGDFVSRAVALVKMNAGQRNIRTLSGQLKELRGFFQEKIPSFKEVCEVIEQVKQTGLYLEDLPTIFQHLLIGIQPTLSEKESQGFFTAEGFASLDETLRLECAKIDLERDVFAFCKNFKSYCIENEEARVALAKIAAQKSGEAISQYLPNFAIEKEADRIEIAWLASTEDGVGFSNYVKNYAIQNQKVRLELAKSILQKPALGFSEYIRNFAIEDQEDRIRIAELVVKQDISFPKYLPLYEIEDENALFELAKLIINSNIPLLSFCKFIKNFGNEETRLDIVRILVKKAPMHLCILFDAFAISNESDRIEIAMQAALRDGRSLAVNINKFNISDQIALVEIARLALGQNPIGASEFFPRFGIKDLHSCAELFFLVRCSNECIQHLNHFFPNKEEAFKIYTELHLLDVGHRIENFTLLDAALTFPNQSKPFVEAWQNLADKVEKETSQAIKKAKTQWLASFLFACRFKRIPLGELVSEMPLLEFLLELKEPSLRIRLQDSLITLLGNAKFVEEFRSFQILKKTSAKKQFLSLPLMVSIPYLGKQELAQTVLKILNDKYFKDKSHLKSLLSSLELIAKEPKFPSSEKTRILEKFIFNPKANNARARSEEVASAAQLIVQLIQLDKHSFLQKAETVSALKEQVKQLYISALDLDGISDFDNKFNKTFFQFRKWNALLTYVAKIQALPKEQFAEVFSSIQIYARSVLNGEYAKERYDLESSEHLKRLHYLAPELLEAWKKGMKVNLGRGYHIIDTDDPCDMLVSGTEVDSCQKVDGDPTFSKCLPAYLLKGEIRMMAIKNPKGVIIARSMMRLLLDKDKNTPVLLQEPIYPKNPQDKYAKLLSQACLGRAQELGIPLLSQELPQAGEIERYSGTILCLPGRTPFEYVDSSTDGIKSGKEGYVIPGNTLFLKKI